MLTFSSLAPSQVISPLYNRQAKIEAVRNALTGVYNTEVVDPTERDEHRRNFDKLIAEEGPQKDIILKTPAKPAFIRWDQDGFARASDPDTAKGCIARDTQYIQTFTLADEEGRLPQKLQSHVADNRQEADYDYRYLDKPNLQVHREETLTPNGVSETFKIQNQDSWDHYLRVNLGTGFRDFFQVRSGAEARLASMDPLLRKEELASNMLEVDATSAPFMRFNQTPNEFSLITMHQENIPIQQRAQLNAHQDKAEMQWLLDIPAHTNNAFFNLNISGRNAQLAQVNHTATNSTPPPSLALPRTSMEIAQDLSGKAIEHLPNTLAVGSKDLQMLSIPINNPNPKNGLGTTFYPPAAGIPNFVALFGRDTLITSLFTLQFQPEIARQTLLALAAYQGKKHDSFTQEEPGKILHELRQGELTRLGYRPEKPSYSTLDATPLFVILYDAYMQRTGDVALGQALKPNVQAALGWLEKNTQGHPSGFLTQRDSKVGLKNIGWKDSQYALRHILQNGKLTDPLYPVAPAEVQSQVHQAWEAAARLFPEKANHYNAEADKLKQSFRMAFWLPNQEWNASALDVHGKPVASIASNGAQALWGDLLTPEQAQKIQHRALQPDLLSGWGIRTLSSAEPAFNPISYHNGTIWPHDNALIAMGAKRNGCDVLTQNIADQILQAARLFPQNRLPELYSGLERQDRTGIKDTNILEYPETCTIQAWASATPFSLISTLLGLDIRQKNGQAQVQFKKPSLPTGVNAFQMTRIPLNTWQSIDILARRDPNTQKVNVWTKSASPFSQWTPANITT